MTSLTDLAGTYTIDPAHSRLGFVARHAMITKVRGHFENVEGTGTVTSDGQAAVDVVIDAASITTSNAQRDEHLRSNDFLDLATYPRITFVSTQVSPTSDGADITGDLTIKGVTKPVTLTVTSFQAAQHPMLKKDAIGANAYTVIKRSDFGAAKYVPAVSDEVRIDVAIEAIAQ